MISRAVRLVERAAEVGWATLRARTRRKRGERHSLAKEVIVSLTSYPPRFATLHLTLRTLLSQSVSPDRLLLWVAAGDFARLPADVIALQGEGLTIRACDDLGSFKKIVPALEEFPEAILVTADDDLYYHTDWLRELTLAAKESPDAIIAHRINRPLLANGRVSRLATWEMNASGPELTEPTLGLFPCTGAGALFPPGSLHHEVTKRDLFKTLSASCDDSWVAWMAALQRTPIRRPTATKRRMIAWRGTIAGSLWIQNAGLSDNCSVQDRIIARLMERYGNPFADATKTASLR